jgi:hypothetical protein
MEKDAGNSGEEYREHYNVFNDISLPDIDSVKRRELEAFPPYEELCKKSGLVDADTLYNSYRHLSGMPHGDLLSVFRIHQDQGQEEYRQVMMEAARWCIEILKLTDFHLNYATKGEVADALGRVNLVANNFKI